jgi:hypothetical protein
MPIAGHVAVPIGRALQEYRSFEHLIGYFPFSEPRDTSRAHLRALAEATQRAGVWNCPTLVTGAASWAPRGFVKALQDAGAGLLPGTDVPGLPVQIAAALELEMLVAEGLTPYQALLTGTRNAATYFGAAAEAGTVAAGKRADLVLLHGNPLQDVWHVWRPAGVMIGGRWLPREEIDRRIPTAKVKFQPQGRTDTDDAEALRQVLQFRAEQRKARSARLQGAE